MTQYATAVSRLGVSALLAIAVIAVPASAQQTAEQHACYIPGSGTIYRIKVANTPTRCGAGHHEFTIGALSFGSFAAANANGKGNGNSGGGSTLPTNDAGAIDLSNDNGFLSVGTQWTGTIPATGAGTRFMWYPAKAALRAGRVLGTAWDDANVGQYSVALGGNPQASAEGAIALGSNAKATAFNAIAIGIGATASGLTSTAIGNNVTASNTYAVSLGYNTLASAGAALATGSSTVASGSTSTATGNATNASGSNAFAGGFQSEASGSASFAMGNLARAKGAGSAAVGGNVEASGANATAFGLETLASGQTSFAVGHTAKATALGASAVGSEVTASGIYSNVFGRRASSNGKVGAFVYGDASSASSVAAATDNQFVVRAQKIWLGTNNSVTSTANRFLETSTGAYLSTGGVWISSSDSTKKHHWADVDGEAVLASLATLPIQTWSYRVEDDAVRHMGPTAQDFRAAFGLGDTDRGIAGVDADGVSLAGIKALIARTAELRSELETMRTNQDTLHTQMAALRRDNDALQAMLGDLLLRLAAVEASAR